MKITLNDLAVLLNGEVSGDGQVVIERIRGIEEAEEGDLTFIANPKYGRKLLTTRASAVLVSFGTPNPGKNLLLVADPYVSMAGIVLLFHPEPEHRPGTSELAFVGTGAIISEEATIYPGVIIGRGARVERCAVLHPGVYIGDEAVVGEGSVLHPNVVVYRKCLIGRHVILHAGVVVGSDGFGFASPGRENVKIPQVGIVQIDDDVEIGANTTIDRGTFGRTWIQRGAKIDNLVQIGHNVTVGENSIIVAQAGISGSTKLGRGVILGGQAGLVGHIAVGDHVMVAAQSGVHGDVPSDRIIAGSPHVLRQEWLRIQACIPRLPEMRKTVASLLKRIEEIEAKLARP